MLVEVLIAGFQDELEKIAYRPYSWMSRPELLQEKKKLTNSYFESNLGSMALGAGIGSIGGGAPLAAISAKIRSPGIRKALRRSLIPASVVGGIVGAMAAPNMKKNRIARDLFEVESRLGQTSYSSLKKGLRPRQ